MKRMIGSGGIAFLAVLCLPQLLNLRGNGLALSNSWLGVFLWAVVWLLTDRAGMLCLQKEMPDADGEALCRRKIQRPDTKNAVRGRMAAGLLGFLFSLCLAFGSQLDYAGNVNVTNGMMWLSIGVWSAVFYFWILAAWMWLEGRSGAARPGLSGAGMGKEAAIMGMHGEAARPGLSGAGMGNEAASMGMHGEAARPGADRQEKGSAAQQACSGFKPVAVGFQWAAGKWGGLSGKQQAVLTACFFLISWLPVFLAVYPGFFVYDAQDELMQVQTRNFTTHHPLPHVVLLGGIILAVNKLTGSYNAGIAVYTLFQMGLMAALFSYVLFYMKRRGISCWLRLLSGLYFAFFPVIVMFVLCSAKDGIFSGALLLLLTVIADMSKNREGFFAGWKGSMLFAFSAILMMSFRHNGMYALLAMVPILIAAMKGYRKKLGILLAAVFALWYLLNTGLATVLQAEASGSQEMLTVPIQQLARTWKHEREGMTEEQLAALYEILPEEALSRYRPKLSDGVKAGFQNEVFRADPAKYAGLWLELGLRHPLTYLNGWLMTSYGFWYPDTVIDVYRGNTVFTFTYEDSSFFGYEVEQPGVREGRLPWLAELYRSMSLEIAQQKLPVVSMLFSPGFLFWVYAFAAGYAFYRQKYELLLPFALLFLVWLTVLLGPTFLPRYVLILWFALPMAVAVVATRDGSAK